MNETRKDRQCHEGTTSWFRDERDQVLDREQRDEQSRDHERHVVPALRDRQRRDLVVEDTGGQAPAVPQHHRAEEAYEEEDRDLQAPADPRRAPGRAATPCRCGPRRARRPLRRSARRRAPAPASGSRPTWACRSTRSGRTPATIRGRRSSTGRRRPRTSQDAQAGVEPGEQGHVGGDRMKQCSRGRRDGIATYTAVAPRRGKYRLSGRRCVPVPDSSLRGADFAGTLP